MMPTSPAYDQASVRHPLKSYDEFTRLRAIVVGCPAAANDPEIDIWFANFFQPPDELVLRRSGIGPVPQVAVDEIEEDIQGFISVLHKHDVEVLRPVPLDCTVRFATHFWSSTQLYSLMPRDSILVVGDAFIEVPSPTRCRYFETFAFRSLMEAYVRKGALNVIALRYRDGRTLGGSWHCITHRDGGLETYLSR